MLRRQRKTRKMRELEEKYGTNIRSLLVRKYLEYGNMDQVGAELGVSVSCISNWFMRFDIPNRQTIDAKYLRIR